MNVRTRIHLRSIRREINIYFCNPVIIIYILPFLKTLPMYDHDESDANNDVYT